jgi:hypothetical protein
MAERAQKKRKKKIKKSGTQLAQQQKEALTAKATCH